jgi:hypothetical protein
LYQLLASLRITFASGPFEVCDNLFNKLQMWGLVWVQSKNELVVRMTAVDLVHNNCRNFVPTNFPYTVAISSASVL